MANRCGKMENSGRCWERLKAGGEGGDRGWNGWVVSLTQWTWWSKHREMVKDREAWGAAVRWVAKSQIGLSDWTTTTQFQDTVMCIPGMGNKSPAPKATLLFLLFLLYLFLCSSWGSHRKYIGWFAIPCSSGSHFVRTLHHDLSILGGCTLMW